MKTFKFEDLTNISKGELAAQIYPGQNFDCAIPQHFIKKCWERGFEDVSGHFVTLYPDNGIDYIAPITAEGIRIASILAMS